MRQQSFGSRLFFALFALALVLRGGLAIIRPPADDGDQRQYRSLATSVAQGTGYLQDGAPETNLHPALPSLHALGIRLFSRVRLVGMALTILIGALLPAFGARTVAMLFGRAAGISAGVLLALEPHHVLASARLEPDLLAALVCFWIVALLWRRDAGLAGAVTGLGYLVRPELILLAPAAAVAARARGAGFVAIMRLCVAVIAVSAIFLLFVHAASGRWALTGKDHWQYLLGVHQARTWDQPLDPASVPALRLEIDSAFNHVMRHPGEFVNGYLVRSALLARNLARQLLFVLVPFAIFGIVWGLRTNRQATLFLLMPLVIVPIYPLVGTFFRHSIIPGSFLLAFAGVGLAACVRGKDRRWSVQP